MDKSEVLDDLKEDEILEDELIDEEIIDEEEIIDNEKEELFEEKYVRLLAEFDNFKKRTAKESLMAKDNGIMEVLKKLIPTIDTLEKAVEHIEEETEFTKGIKMTYEQLNRSLTELGLEEVSYETFDPNFHMAVLTDNVKGKKEDEIIEILQKGYKFDNRLVRQAMVKVNKK